MRHLWLTILALLFASVPIPAGAHGEVTARSIVEHAIALAGGDGWRDAKTLHMKGHATLYRGGLEERKAEATRYEMWRVYADANDAAHRANGRFRLDAFVGERPIFQTAFDGEHNYDTNGLRADAESSGDDESGAYGFGIIRFALKEGFTLERLADDQIDGNPAYFVRVTDPQGGVTLFGFDAKDYAIRMVAYNTPRGWHERVYSEFEVKEDPRFRQATRVRFFYDGIKTVDVKWEEWSINQPLSIETFRIEPRSIAI